MIKKIQEIESRLFLKLKENEKYFGNDHPITCSSRTRWVGVGDLMEELGIGLDYQSPENKSILKLIGELHAICEEQIK